MSHPALSALAMNSAAIATLLDGGPSLLSNPTASKEDADAGKVSPSRTASVITSERISPSGAEGFPGVTGQGGGEER